MNRITRNHRGVCAHGLPGRYVPRETHLTFWHAVHAYGYLVEPGESLTGPEWIQRIRRQYTSTPRTQAVCLAIETVMP